MATFTGAPGADNFDGTDDDDLFKLYQGGSDTAFGRGGSDLFSMRDALDAGDSLNGGGGDDDTVRLEGDYSSGLVFGADTIRNIEVLELKGAFTYDLTLDDGNLAPGDRLVVDARQTTAAAVDGSSEELGRFVFLGGAGNDEFAGGGSADKFQLRSGGTDQALGGGGDDTFKMKGAFDADDDINGEDGTGDTIILKGDYGTAVTFTSTTVLDVETMLLKGNHDYNLVLDDATVVLGESMTIDGSGVDAAHSVRIDASGSTDGTLTAKGGDGDDVFAGGETGDIILAGAGDDLIDGGNVGDTMTGGAGADTFVYDEAADSTNTSYDVITDFDCAVDNFDLDTAVSDYAGEVSATINSGSFNTDVAAAADPAMDALEAVIIHITGGDLTGGLLLVIDRNSDGSYVAGTDLVISIGAAANLGSFDENSFI